MSLLNQYMHPRNIYRKPPNFKDLAISFPEFRAVAKQDLSGKVRIDFKDKSSLRALTSTLLKKDFDLDVEIPLDRLIPTLPLRLNYLLWIEDLLEFTKLSQIENPVLGLDVGTGATCIYPLLASKKNKWHMQATEIDPHSFEYACRNVDRNGLQQLIKIKQVDAGTVFLNALDNDLIYDFSMCNPPFFSCEQELEPSSNSRSTSRPPPHNAKTGVVGEVVVQGGEISFVTKMILESCQLKTKIRIYTTMVGRKSSVNELKAELEKAGVTSWSQTEFCQGHTTRWGLAWTFMSDISLVTNVPHKLRRKESKTPVLKYVVPKTCEMPEYTVNAVCSRLEALLEELKIEFEQIEKTKHITLYTVTAFANTWSHQRRKRREMKMKNSCDKSLSLPDLPIQNKDNDRKTSNSSKRNNEEIDSDIEEANKRIKLCEDKNDETCQSPDEHAQQTPVLKANIGLKKISGEVNIELSWKEGTLGRNAGHQVLQYLKNHF